MATWIKNSNPDIFIRQLASLEIKKGSGQFKGFGTLAPVIVLSAEIKFKGAIPEIERQRIVRSAIGDAARELKLNKEGVLKHVSKKETEYLRLPELLFRIHTGISIAPSIGNGRYHINDSVIKFGAKISKNGRDERNRIIDEARSNIKIGFPENYTPVSITVNAKTPNEAADRALDSIDLLRAIWNFSINKKVIERHSYGIHRAINSIQLFPVHTLHKENDEIATDTWWYEPDYSGPVALFSSKEKFADVRRFERKVRANMSRLNYCKDWSAALLRYGRALDSSDLHVSFLKLWGVLEALTDSTRSDSSVTTKRGAFLFRDHEYAAEGRSPAEWCKS